MNQSWLVKTKDDNVQGPYQEYTILQKIQMKVFTGEELISQYPYGQWQSISSHPPFYEELLKIITSSKEKRRRKKKTFSFSKIGTESSDSENSITNDSFSLGSVDDSFNTSDSDAFTDEIDSTFSEGISTELDSTEAGSDSEISNINSFKKVRVKGKFSPDSTAIIKMGSSKSEFFKEIRKKILLPISIVAVSLIAFFIFFNPSNEKNKNHSQGLLLRVPKINQIPQSSEVVQNRIKRGLQFYMKDQYSFYLKAQNEFIHAIEGDKKNLIAMSYLCLTYLELWPFTAKDSKATRTIQTMVQKIGKVDQGGVFASLCQIVHILSDEKYSKAESLIQTSIDSATELDLINIIPFFYYLKSVVQKNQLKLQSALTNIEFASNSIPQWIGPYMLKGNILRMKNDLSQSFKVFQSVSKNNPQHKEALLSTGILAYEFLNNIPQAKKMIQAALLSTEKVHSSYLTRAYYVLSQIALKTNNKPQALKFAKKSYTLDPLNVELKTLISKLGGESVNASQLEFGQLIEQGDQLNREGHKHQAESYYKTAFDNSKSPIAATKLGVLLWKSGLPAEAIDWLKKAIAADPKHIKAYTLMANYYSQLYEFNNASRILKKASQISPNSIEVFKGYATLEFRRNNLNKAVGYSRQALSLYESDVDTLIILSKALLSLENYVEALNVATKAKEIDRNNKEAHLQFARALAFVNDIDTGYDYFEKIINNSQTDSNNYFEYVLSASQFLYDHQRYNQALSSLSRLDEFIDKTVSYHLLHGKILSALLKYPSAYNEFIRASALNPAAAEPLFELAQFYKKTGNYLNAEKYFIKILDFNPRYPLIHLNLAKIYFQQALRINQKGKKINSRSKKYFKKALKEIEIENQLSPNLVSAYELAAKIYYRLKKYTLCAQTFQKAIEFMPDNSSLYVQVALCYRHSGRLDLALQILKKISGTDKEISSNPLVYRELGAIYEINRDFINATKAYALYLNLLPNARDRKRIEARVRKFGQ